MGKSKQNVLGYIKAKFLLLTAKVETGFRSLTKKRNYNRRYSGKRDYRKRHVRINKFWLNKTFWILLIIGILLGGFYNYFPEKIAEFEVVLTNAVINCTSKATPEPPKPIIAATNTDIAKIDYRQEFLDIINKARGKKKFTVVDLSSEMSKIADEANATVYEYLMKHPNRLMPYHESYCGSIYVVEGGSQISKSIAESWVNNPREVHKLAYPFLDRIGLSIKAYDQYVICVCIYPMKDINYTDRRYVRLLPVYYENVNSIFPSIGVK
jgi:hypothetical protein